MLPSEEGREKKEHPFICRAHTTEWNGPCWLMPACCRSASRDLHKEAKQKVRDPNPICHLAYPIPHHHIAHPATVLLCETVNE